VAAFRATLEEISSSDLLIHLVDAANPHCQAQIDAVEQIMTDLKLNEIPRLIVFNKADLLDDIEITALIRQTTIEKQIDALAVSAIKPESLGLLLEKVGAILTKNLNENQNSFSLLHQPEEQFSDSAI
jgi:GTP-binding protein HflX